MPVLTSWVHPRKLVSWSMLEEGVGNAELMFTTDRNQKFTIGVQVSAAILAYHTGPG